jgi:hypothetical protein
VDLTRASLLREVLSGTELATRTSQFAHALRRFTTRPSGLMLFGPQDDEPWHLTAHIDEEALRAGITELRPALVRWAPPPDAPPHLRIGLDRLRDVGRGESLMIVSEQQPGSDLLERIHDVRRRGATVFSIDNGDRDLASLSHESLVPGLLVPAAFGSGWTRYEGPDTDASGNDSAAGIDAFDIDPDGPEAGFAMAQHLVSLAVGDDDMSPTGWRARLRSFIERVGGDPRD